MIKEKGTPDCNNCTTDCGGASSINDMLTCKNYARPKSGWMLTELALAYPTSLNKALRQLPFEVNLDFYLR